LRFVSLPPDRKAGCFGRTARQSALAAYRTTDQATADVPWKVQSL